MIEPCNRLTDRGVREFQRDGCLVVRGLLNSEEVARYQSLYDCFLDDVIDAGHLRADLGGGERGARVGRDRERITQIMWPSALIPPLVDGPLHLRSLEISRRLFGQDMDIDFDMLINKPPFSDSPTPWHQDAAYWIDLPDLRAVSVWVALDQTTVDNGCMWFIKGSHLSPMRKHRQIENGRALECEATEQEGEPIPLMPGDATLHHGMTLHYSRGNNTGRDRRAMIVNCRPEQMIRIEREQGMDHGLKSNESHVRSAAAR